MLNPKCLNHNKNYGWNSEGYLLPCCWHDVNQKYRNEIKELFDLKLNINNVNSIEEIINSTEWREFYNNMHNNTCCNFYCGVTSKENKICEKKL